MNAWIKVNWLIIIGHLCICHTKNLVFAPWNGSISSEWSWDKVPKWTDVYFRNSHNWNNLDLKLEFLMDNYDIVSLEKCLYNNGNDHNTEKHFLYLTSKMRSLRPNSKTRILFYWHATKLRTSCYKSGREFDNRPDLFVKKGGHRLWDFRIPEARSMWADGKK